MRNIPRELEPGKLYISMEFGTAMHSCCCGCGEQIVTPFSPTDWSIKFNGVSVSLSPSIGNWNLACRSHYFIDSGRVVEARSSSEAEIEDELRRNKAAKTEYYAGMKPFAEEKFVLDSKQNLRPSDLSPPNYSGWWPNFGRWALRLLGGPALNNSDHSALERMASNKRGSYEEKQIQ